MLMHMILPGGCTIHHCTYFFRIFELCCEARKVISGADLGKFDKGGCIDCTLYLQKVT